MNTTTEEKIKLISFCGLYCAECPKYKKGKCTGCLEYNKATWCKIRTCCLEKNIKSCADCDEYSNIKECKKFNTFIGKLMERVFNSDRVAALEMIRDNSYDHFVSFMSDNNLVTLPRRKKKDH